MKPTMPTVSVEMSARMSPPPKRTSMPKAQVPTSAMPKPNSTPPKMAPNQGICEPSRKERERSTRPAMCRNCVSATATPMASSHVRSRVRSEP